MVPTYDAVVVGARCAGSVTAGLLAREGWNVLLVDKATFPSDTVSTHFMFPNCVARLASLGIMERLIDRYSLPWLQTRWTILGNVLAGSYTPVDGHGAATSIRRVSLDCVLKEWAEDQGAVARFGIRVEALLGEGSADDPVRGVVLQGGEEISARWVIGADGRASTVAALLGLEKERLMAGEQAYLFAYWRGLPRNDFGRLEVGYDHGLMWNPCEDGIHLLSTAGPPDITTGSTEHREKNYFDLLTRFPDVLDRDMLGRAERISHLVVVPETMMRGFFKRSNGPGWALVGDSGHFKHPGTAQGISDAIEQAMFLAGNLSGDEDLSAFESWRNERSEGHYEWSFLYGSWPMRGMAEPYLAGLAADPEAVQDWVDCFSRLKRPADVDTPERLSRWFSGAA